MSGTSIAWTDFTWNPVRGCSRVSEGCRHCYAERLAARNLPELRSPTTGKAFAQMTPTGPRWTGKVELIPSKLDEPLHWRRPRRVFVNSMSDLFHEALDFHDIAAVYGVMAMASRHTFQVLTKRPARRLAFMRWMGELVGPGNVPLANMKTLPLMGALIAADHRGVRPGRGVVAAAQVRSWPLSNVWEGVSVEDQATADERIPLLLQTPAAVRWASYEPALAPVDFSRFLTAGDSDNLKRGSEHSRTDGDVPAARVAAPQRQRPHRDKSTGHELSDQGAERLAVGNLDWIVVGGESGPGARPFNLRWALSAEQQCRAAGVPFFCKQWGARPCLPSCASLDCTHPDCDPGWIQLADRKGGDMKEWKRAPQLRVREFPS